MKAQEKFDDLKHLDLWDAVIPICELCHKNGECSGFFAKSCPFDNQITEVLDHLYEADLAIQDGIKFAETYDEYCRTWKVELIMQSA